MSYVARNISWNILGNLGGKVIAPLFQLFIARLIVPDDFGIFAVAIAWLAAFDAVKDFGLSQAIVIRRGEGEMEALQFSVQFTFAMIFVTLTALIGPFVARWFEEPALAEVGLIVSLVGVVSAAADPVVTLCLKEQRYKQLAGRQVVTPLAGGVTGLVLAYHGYGAHALAMGLLAGHAAGGLTLLLASTAHLRFRADGRALRELLSLGVHIMIQRLFGFLVGHADSLIVGGALGSSALGQYRMSNMLAFLGPTAFATQIEQVLFTDASSNPSEQNLKRRYHLYNHVVGPALLLYSVTTYFLAPPLVPILMGEQWESTVPFIQLLSAASITGFLTPLNIDFAKILGFASAYTRYAAARSVGTVLAVAIASAYSVTHVIVTWILSGLAFHLINDIVFFRNQNVVRPSTGKIALTLAAWAWTAFVIVRLFL